MQANDVASTHPHSPYDALRPMRCRFELDGRFCTGRSADIDWNRPGTHCFKCQKCRTYNVVHVVEAAP